MHSNKNAVYGLISTSKGSQSGEAFNRYQDEKYRRINENFSCIRTSADWQKFWIRFEDHQSGYKRNLSDIEWTKLFSVIQGYRMGLWDIPEITACGTVAEKLAVINKYNRSGKIFNQNAWKNSRKPERASQMLPKEIIDDLLEEFGIQ